MRQPVLSSRRAVLGSAVTLTVGASLRRLPRPVTAQESPISIDRTVGDRVVLPAEPDATLTGSSTLQQNTDFLVRVFSQEAPAFNVETGTVVTADGTWSATVDLSEAVDGQAFTAAAVFNGDRVASAPGLIGPLSGSVRFDDQRLSADERQVRVAGARLDLGGFVVVREGSDGSIRGVSNYLESGSVHTDIPVTLDAPVDGGERLVATAWLDVNGDRLFGLGVDRPYPAGNPVSDSAFISAPEPETPTRTRTPPSSGSGLDVAVAVAGGALGVFGLRRAGRWLARAVRKRRGGNRPPVANVVSIPDTPRPGVPVLFDGSLSFDPDPDDSIRQYEWSIGEVTSHGPRWVHVFGATGDYDVTLRVEDQNGADGRTGTTVTVEAAGRLELAAVNPDAPGDDWDRLRHESLLFRNAGDAVLDLSGWTVSDAAEAEDRVSPGAHAYTFPDGVELDGSETVAVHTGAEPENEEKPTVTADHHCYWGSAAPIWNNQADRVILDAAADNPVLAARYEGTEGGAYRIEDVEPTKLADWFEPVDLREPLHIPILGVTIGPSLGLRAVENAIEFVAACLYRRGSAAFAKAWALLASFLALSILTWLLSVGSGTVLPSIRIGGPLALLVGALSLTTVGGVAWATGALWRTLGRWLS